MTGPLHSNVLYSCASYCNTESEICPSVAEISAYYCSTPVSNWSQRPHQPHLLSLTQITCFQSLNYSFVALIFSFLLNFCIDVSTCPLNNLFVSRLVTFLFRHGVQCLTLFNALSKQRTKLSLIFFLSLSLCLANSWCFFIKQATEKAEDSKLSSAYYNYEICL